MFHVMKGFRHAVLYCHGGSDNCHYRVILNQIIVNISYGNKKIPGFFFLLFLAVSHYKLSYDMQHDRVLTNR